MTDDDSNERTNIMHPATQAILQFFAYAHLPPHLQAVSKPFGELADKIAAGPQNAESTVALRKLLEAKDAAVRAVLFKAPPRPTLAELEKILSDEAVAQVKTP